MRDMWNMIAYIVVEVTEESDIRPATQSEVSNAIPCKIYVIVRTQFSSNTCSFAEAHGGKRTAKPGLDRS